MSVLPGSSPDSNALTQGVQSVASGVMGALRRAASTTGVDFG